MWMREQEKEMKQSMGTGATAIADAVEESAMISAGAEVASAVAGERPSDEHEHDSALEAVQAIEALSWSTGVKDK